MIARLGLSRSGEHGAVREDFMDIPPDWPNRSASRIVESGGSHWHLQRMGAGRGLLLLHGTAASTHTWRDLMPMLARDFDVVAIDLPGHGFSDRLQDGAMTLPAIAASVAELLHTIDFEPQVVAGHSAGAAIALRMSLDAAIRPTHIVGINAALLPFGGAMRRLFSPMARMFASTRLMPQMLAKRARDPKAVARIINGTGSRIDQRGVELYQQLLMRESHIAAVLSLMASWDLDPLIADLERLEPRLALIAGLLDKAVSPREADTIADVVPDASVIRLADCGHLAHEEQPERVFDNIVRFTETDRNDV